MTASELWYVADFTAVALAVIATQRRKRTPTRPTYGNLLTAVRSSQSWLPWREPHPRLSTAEGDPGPEGGEVTPFAEDPPAPRQPTPDQQTPNTVRNNMPVTRNERLDEVLRMRTDDPQAWAQLHPRVQDEAQCYADILASEQRNAERPPIGDPEVTL